MKYINQIINIFKSKGLDAIPSREKDINKLKNIASDYFLPKAYIEFMKFSGNGVRGECLAGDSCFMDEIGDLKIGAIELLDDNECSFKLNDDDFVFWMSQGCMFTFFKLNEGENPPIYFYNESSNQKFIKIADSLTEFLENRITLNPQTFKENVRE